MRIPVKYILFAVALLSYCLYPAWYLPVTGLGRLLLLNAFFLGIALPLLLGVKDGPDIHLSGVFSRSFFREWGISPIIMAIPLLFHLPFWGLPVHILNDEQSHAGPPAYVLGHVASLVPLPLVQTCFLLAAIGLIFFLVRKRDCTLSPNFWATIVVSFVAVNLYFFVVSRFQIPGVMGSWVTILRYPPVAKFIYLAGYGIAGISEWVPRFVQFLFITATALLLSKTLELEGIRHSRSFAFLSVSFFPTFFELGNTAELEGGTVFFFAAVVYFYLRSIRCQSQRDLFLCLTFLSIGFLYKQLLLGLFLMMAAYNLYYFFRNDPNPMYRSYLKRLWIPGLLGIPFIALSWLFNVRDGALQLSNFLHPGLVALNAQCAYQTLGPVISAAVLAASLFALLRLRFGNHTFNFMFLVLTGYYLLITGTAAVGYLRHSQPFFVPLVFFFSLFLSCLSGTFTSKMFSRTFQFIILCLLVYHAVFQWDPFQRTTLITMHQKIMPYDPLVQHLRATAKTGLRVYAPMGTDPSHFYLAKRGLAGRVAWDREMPPRLTAADAVRYYDHGKFDYLFLPYAAMPELGYDFIGLVDYVLKTGHFRVVRIFESHGSSAVLLSKKT